MIGDFVELALFLIQANEPVQPFRQPLVKEKSEVEANSQLSFILVSQILEVSASRLLNLGHQFTETDGQVQISERLSKK